jgi:hypothetical protein
VREGAKRLFECDAIKIDFYLLCKPESDRQIDETAKISIIWFDSRVKKVFLFTGTSFALDALK